MAHKPDCNSRNDYEWIGSPNPANPDNEWICDECGAIITAEDRDTAYNAKDYARDFPEDA